jgi:immune inhibitor A
MKSRGRLLAPPSPEVRKAIEKEIKAQGMVPADRRFAAAASRLGAPTSSRRGINDGVFYPEEDMPLRADGAFAFSPSRAGRARPTTGTLKCLILLVDFADNPGHRTPQDFKKMLFSKGQLPTGSMREFYAENSYGQTDLDGDVLGWLRLPQPYSYYVDGENGTGAYPNNAQKMTEDALALAAQQVNFKTFDADGDGYIDGLFVVHAGGGAEADPNLASRKTKIWSHQSQISKVFTANGTKAFAYCTEPEDGKVGVFSHEFGHMLGLPDLYDTTYNSEGVGVWCVMGGGSWLGGGDTPGHFCAWSKSRLGWITPKVVKTAASLQVAPAETNKDAVYRLWTKGKTGPEYFLIENRRRIGFDKKLPAEGLLVWHVDDSEHNNDHPGAYWVGLVQADGKQDLERNRNDGDTGDVFPGASKKKAWGPTTTPDSSDQLGAATGVAVTAIAVSNQSVSCKVKV